MISVKEHNLRLDQHRQSTADEISGLSAAKFAALAERETALTQMTAVVQDCRREAYTLRRIASNIAIHCMSDAAPKNSGELERSSSSMSLSSDAGTNVTYSMLAHVVDAGTNVTYSKIDLLIVFFVVSYFIHN
jgi:hypothetical protein